MKTRDCLYAEELFQRHQETLDRSLSSRISSGNKALRTITSKNRLGMNNILGVSPIPDSDTVSHMLPMTSKIGSPVNRICSTRLAVGVATIGRPDVLMATILSLRQQSRQPDRIIVCYTSEGDLQRDWQPPLVEFILAPAGSSRQRNAIIDLVGDCSVLLFLDDDFLPDPHYIEATIAAFEAESDVVVTTGLVLADGVTGPGLAPEVAQEILSRDRSGGPGLELKPVFNGYGCNMAVRLSTIRVERMRFDERLPLYGWYEDVDFTRRLGRHGRIVQIRAARGVHLGTKSGRTSGLRLGYSQIANPIYLLHKGSVPLGFVFRSVGRHLLINSVRSFWPEPYVDRRGRLAGNILALLEFIRGKLRPERILELHQSRS